jgi:hypothetical protein
VVGFSRAIYAAKGWAYYEANGFFWAKIAAFATVGLLSIIPTIKIIRWRRALTADPAFLPAAPDIGGVRRYLWAEVALFAFIPVFAAAITEACRRSTDAGTHHAPQLALDPHLRHVAVALAQLADANELRVARHRRHRASSSRFHEKGPLLPGSFQ